MFLKGVDGVCELPMHFVAYPMDGEKRDYDSAPPVYLGTS